MILVMSVTFLRIFQGEIIITKNGVTSIVCLTESGKQRSLDGKERIMRMLILSILLVTLGTAGIFSTVTGNRRPNVIIFYVDDMGWAGVGSYGCDFIDTPEIDILATDGVRFTDAYSPAPNCSPAAPAC